MMYYVCGLMIFWKIIMLHQYVSPYIKTPSDSIHISEFVPVCSSKIWRKVNK